MRHFIDIIESASKPDVLYHGTTAESMIGILSSGVIEYRDGIDAWLGIHDGVSLTADKDVAWAFANTATHDGDLLHNEFSDEDDDNGGAVFHIDPSKVGASYVRYNNSDAENEWRTHEEDIPLSAVIAIEIRKQDLVNYLDHFQKARAEGYPDSSVLSEKAWNEFFNDPKKLSVMKGLMSHPLIRFV
jgi:hypothetical protein